jgi:hypothetical protein
MEANKNIEPEQPPENIPKEIIPSQENILPDHEKIGREIKRIIYTTVERQATATPSERDFL